MIGRYWSDAENDILRTNMHRTDREIHAELLAIGSTRDYKSIQPRRSRLGLPKPSTDWPESLWLRTKAMIEQGFGPAYIARELSLTPGQVAGKMHRHGLKSLPREPRPAPPRKRYPQSRPKAKTRPVEPLGDIRGLRIADQGFGGCRWPLSGSGYELRMCCRPTIFTHCAEHAVLAYAPKVARAA